MPEKSLWNIFDLRRVTQSTTYVPQIDGLRFLALLPVLFWHSGLRGLRFSNAAAGGDAAVGLPHGHIGVYLFFFVSGYIIAYPFFKKGMQNIGTFYARRISRLHLPYLIAIFLCFVALSLSHYHPANAPSFNGQKDISLVESLFASAFYLHGLLFNSPPKLNPPAWSLEIEIQFYLIAPLIFLLISKVKESVFPILLFVTISLAILSLYLNVTFGHYGWHNRTVIGYLYIFVLGIAFGYYSVTDNPFVKPAKWLFDIGFATGIAIWVYTGYLEQQKLGISGYINLYFCQLVAIPLIYLGAARGIIFRRVLAWPWLCILGGMCFSIYLVHVPLMQIGAELLFRYVHVSSLSAALWVSFATLIPLSLLAGSVFFVLVERPCMDPQWPNKLKVALNSYVSNIRRRASE